jgi:hypothetical protein
MSAARVVYGTVAATLVIGVIRLGHEMPTGDGLRVATRLLQNRVHGDFGRGLNHVSQLP